MESAAANDYHSWMAASRRTSTRRARTAKPEPLAACPVERAIHVIGGKWKLLVLRSLLLNGPQRYNDLLLSVTGISAKELTRNVRELTRAGLVADRQDRSDAYALTKLGAGLMPVFKRLLPWGRRLIAVPATQ
jgi:DNA-binding HxlR family transcriptional regulator